MSCQPAVDACDPVSLRPCVPADLPFLQRLYASTRAAEVQASGWPAAAAEGRRQTPPSLGQKSGGWADLFWEK